MMQAVRSAEVEHDRGNDPVCYSLTIFTQRWREIRDFYVEVLKARVLSERPDRYAEIDFGGVPLCIEATEAAGMVTHLRLYVSMQNLEPLVADLRERGVIVVKDGPYVKFRDPEGRMIKASETFAILS